MESNLAMWITSLKKNSMIATNLSQRNHLKSRQRFIHKGDYWELYIAMKCQKWLRCLRTALIKIWYIPRNIIMHKKYLMLRKYSHAIMQNGIKQEAKLNKQHNSILFFKSSKEKEGNMPIYWLFSLHGRVLSIYFNSLDFSALIFYNKEMVF